jgi:hypothetical protein
MGEVLLSQLARSPAISVASGTCDCPIVDIGTTLLLLSGVYACTMNDFTNHLSKRILLGSNVCKIETSRVERARSLYYALKERLEVKVQKLCDSEKTIELERKFRIQKQRYSVLHQRQTYSCDVELIKRQILDLKLKVQNAELEVVAAERHLEQSRADEELTLRDTIKELFRKLHIVYDSIERTVNESCQTCGVQTEWNSQFDSDYAEGCGSVDYLIRKSERLIQTLPGLYTRSEESLAHLKQRLEKEVENTLVLVKEVYHQCEKLDSNDPLRNGVLWLCGVFSCAVQLLYQAIDVFSAAATTAHETLQENVTSLRAFVFKPRGLQRIVTELSHEALASNSNLEVIRSLSEELLQLCEHHLTSQKMLLQDQKCAYDSVVHIEEYAACVVFAACKYHCLVTHSDHELCDVVAAAKARVSDRTLLAIVDEGVMRDRVKFYRHQLSANTASTAMVSLQASWRLKTNPYSLIRDLQRRIESIGDIFLRPARAARHRFCHRHTVRFLTVRAFRLCRPQRILI